MSLIQSVSLCFLDPPSTRTVVEPIPKAIEAVLDKIFRCPEVEPRIDCKMSVSLFEEDLRRNSA